MKRTAGIFLVFSLVGFIVFANAWDNPFQFDDLHSIVENPNIRSLDNLPGFFTNLHTFSVDQRGTMFRPLLLTTYALNYAVHGKQVVGYRLVNLLLHLFCSLLLVGCIARMIRRQDLALAVGWIFLLHPIHGETINYISSRSDLLVSFFFLLALFFLIQREGKGTWRDYRATVLAYIAGLLSKSVAITFPVVVVGYGLWQGGWRQVEKRWRAVLLLGLATISYLGIITANRFLSSSMAKAPRDLDVHLWTQLKAFIYYLWLFCVPVRLSVEHQFFVSASLIDPVPVLAGLLLFSLVFFMLYGLRYLPTLGYAWFIVTLLPASLVPLNILVSERRMYLASAGLALIGGWAWRQLARRHRRFGLIIGVLTCLTYAGLTVERNRVWASPMRLWEDAVGKGPQMFRAQTNLALAYVKEGREDEALKHLRTALDSKPDFADAWIEMGNILQDKGEMAQAEDAYKKALSFSPSMEGAYYNLGNIYLKSGHPAAALEYYNEALGRNPQLVIAYNNRGQAYEALGELERAVGEYRMALQQDSELPQAWFNLAVALERQGSRQEAAQAYGKARDLLLVHPEYENDLQYQEFARRATASALRLQSN